MAVFDGRHYLSEMGMRRAANMSRIQPYIIRNRHGAYLDRWYREHEQHHNDGVNRLVARFAREGVAAVAGWRGEVNVPGLTQVRPDLLVQVSEGALGTGVHCIEFERSAVTPYEVEDKLGPYRRMAAAGGPLPLLMVCETARGRRNFQGRCRNAANADRHLGAGAGGAADRRGYGVEQERHTGGAPLPKLTVMSALAVQARSAPAFRGDAVPMFSRSPACWDSNNSLPRREPSRSCIQTRWDVGQSDERYRFRDFKPCRVMDPFDADHVLWK